MLSRHPGVDGVEQRARCGLEKLQPVIAALPQAGGLNDSPRVSTAQAMRAFLAAMAATAFQ